MGHPQYERTVEDTKADENEGTDQEANEQGGDSAEGNGTPQVHVAPSEWDPPYLPRALLYASIGQKEWFRTSLDKAVLAGSKERVSLQKNETFVTELTDLLQHIVDRLDLGVMEAWFSIDGYGDYWAEMEEVKAIYEKTEGDLAKKGEEAFVKMAYLPEFYAQPEEVWARAFCEMISFLPYAGVDPKYGNQRKVYEKFPDGAYPAVVACQDLCTLCVLSRGFTYKDLSKWLKEGIPLMVDGKPVLDANGRPVIEKYVDKEYHGLDCTAGSATYPAFDSSYRPSGGTNYKNVKNLSKLHNKTSTILQAGSILIFNASETATSPAGDAHIISVLRVSGERIQFLETGITDELHHFVTEEPPFGKWCAVGVLKDPPVDLVECAKRMTASRPLAYARLVVLDTSTDPATPRFVSKLFHMRRHMSHWVWALKGLPINDLRVVVHFYIPCTEAATDALLADDGLTTPPAQLLPASGTLDHVTSIRGEPNGDVVVSRRRGAKLNGQDQDVWYENLDDKSKTLRLPQSDDFGGKLVVAQKKLSEWCLDTESAKLQYVCKPPKINENGQAEAAVEEIDEGTTGVTFFDP